jgi:hypothetical protein
VARPERRALRFSDTQASFQLYREVFSWRGLRRRLGWGKPAWVTLANLGMHTFAQGLRPQHFV